MSKPAPETQNEAPEADMADSKLIAKLKKHKAQKTGFDTTVLPETGITASWPQFKPHGIWMKATRLAKGNPQTTMNIYLPLICTFDGEKLTMTEFKEYVPTDDVMHLFGEVMGGIVPDDESDDDEGNALH